MTKKCEECNNMLKITEHRIYLGKRNLCSRCFQKLKLSKRNTERGVRRTKWLA